MLFPSLSLIKNLPLKLSKRRGQNFLVDKRIAQNIIDACQLVAGDTVIEIGPGLGALTCFLADRVKKVICIEIDQELVHLLSSALPEQSPVTLINHDILKIKFSDILNGDDKAIVIGNIPYSITTPLVLKLIQEAPFIKRAIVMLQKEVWERLQASPGDKNYGLLTIFAQAYLKTRFLFNVSAARFYPKPKVDSLVIEIAPASARSWDDKEEEVFRQVVTLALSQRRKTLTNCLKDFISWHTISGAQLKTCAIQEGIDLQRRGETLSLKEFDTLTGILKVML